MIRTAWHLVRALYYQKALEYLSTCDPMNQDLLYVIIEHNRSREIIDLFLRSTLYRSHVETVELPDQ
jgi:hypothetical protein